MIPGINTVNKAIPNHPEMRIMELKVIQVILAQVRQKQDIV